MSLDRVAWPDRRDEMIIVGCVLVDPAMWPVVVVVIDVLDEQRVQLALVPDDCPVEQLVAQRSDPSFGESVRLGCSWRDWYRGPRALEFAKALEDSSRLYAAILNGDHDHWSGWGTTTKDNLETLGRLALEQNRPMLLAALSEFPRAEMKKALRGTVGWSVRGLIVGGIGGGTTEKAYAQAAVEIRGGSVKTAFQLMNELQSIIPSDAEFEASFKTARVFKASLSRYYLLALERQKRGDSEPELVPNANEDEVNLEHVLPKNATVTEWPDFTSDESKDWVHRLGNQGLLKKSHNRRIGNKPFSRKKPILAASDLALTETIGKQSAWTKKEIEARQVVLAALAPKVWKRRP